MGKRIACICGKPGRVQHTRMKFLRDNYLPYLDVYAGDVPDLSKYEVVYFSHYSLARKVEFSGIKLASVTSHKYDREKLELFDRISVNNRLLLSELREFSPVLTENGVDTKFWVPLDVTEYSPMVVVGWVGNKDRLAKRYDYAKKMSMETRRFLDWRMVVTSKKDSGQKKTPEEMREFYNSVDVYVVTSSSEGTPNPALEAMACGVPVVSPRVGNMPEVAAVWDYETDIEMVGGIFQAAYSRFAEKDARCDMVTYWDWSIKYKAWDNFFKEWL